MRVEFLRSILAPECKSDGAGRYGQAVPSAERARLDGKLLARTLGAVRFQMSVVLGERVQSAEEPLHSAQ